jgi:hypothetical protein
LFGLELQASGNLFISGVHDRDVAYRHDSKLLAVEGDETLTAGALSELEFVTSACRTLDDALKAVGYACQLAVELAKLAQANGPVLSFREGEKSLGGTWFKTCTLKIGDPGFAAKPQGTVGVPLARLQQFIEEVLRGDDQDKAYLNDLEKMRELSGFGTVSPEMAGFLTACRIFLLWATWNNSKDRAIGADGRPLLPKDGDFWRVFTIPSDDYLKLFEYKAGDGYVPSFYKANTGNCRVLVHRDSPKSSFKLLHRTDFHSMFHALEPGDQQALHTEPGTWPQAVWPHEWGRRNVLMFPYRADPPELNVQIPQYQAEGWTGDAVNRPETWGLIEHGPALADWWDSVVNGRSAPGALPDAPKMVKDLASPPPGLAGRSRDKIASFPGDDENKRHYYGMGAFPMDTRDVPKPLAVYEHRAFADHPQVKALGTPTKDKWADIVNIFHKLFVGS